jgi:DNA polymerase-3 subunit gamma/tau
VRGETAPLLDIRAYDDVIAHVRALRDRPLLFALERHIRPVRFEPGRMEISLTPEAEPDLPQRLARLLQDWTGKRWMISVSQEASAQTVHETRQRSRAALMEEVRADPLVRRVLERFPGAEIVDVRDRAGAEDAEEAPLPVADALPGVQDESSED